MCHYMARDRNSARSDHLEARRVEDSSGTVFGGGFGPCCRGRPESTLQHLPHDVLYHIATFLGVPDVVSLQEALPLLSAPEVSYSLWSRIYQNSSLPRPPGPLTPTEIDNHILTLRQSAQVERTWAEARAQEEINRGGWIYSETPGSKYELSRKRSFELPFKEDAHEGKFGLVSGRWLFLAIPREGRVICYDLNASETRLGEFTEVYKSREAGILHFACVESSGLNGEPIAFAAVKERCRSASVPLDDVPVQDFPHKIKILKIEAPSFSSSAGIDQVHLQEVLVSPNNWHGPTFTIALGPTLLVAADSSSHACETGVLCMDVVSYEMYQLPIVKTPGSFDPVAVTFVPCTTYILVIKVFRRANPGAAGAGEGFLTVVDAYDLERPLAPNWEHHKRGPRHLSEAGVLRQLGHTHHGITTHFVRDAKLLEDPTYSVAIARVVPESIAALRGYRTSPLSSPLTITATFVGIRNLSQPLRSSFLGILRLVLSPVEPRSGRPPASVERSSLHRWIVLQSPSPFQQTVSSPIFQGLGDIAVEYTPLYPLPAPLRLSFFQPTVNGSTRGIIFMPAEEQITDTYKARSSPVLPVFEGVWIRLGAMTEEEAELTDAGENSNTLDPIQYFSDNPALPPGISSTPRSAPVRITVTSLPHLATIFPPVLLAFDAVRGRMVFMRLGALSPARLEHWPKIEIWDYSSK
ncbi:hypothetical protein HYDPIDRAFT_111349 [Hydnomerulius pinastri MD-312]|uniref:F-box domain-containing protein n=1 Tax=Hydnomerulius pinastri MD-312 TaxID=994086 RepID=A0A0C9W1J7_9AGAM|nr:hypothetical protein HYDPIDRAFT_111349 [Hydnomerulius pinastri MD-312]